MFRVFLTLVAMWLSRTPWMTQLYVLPLERMMKNVEALLEYVLSLSFSFAVCVWFSLLWVLEQILVLVVMIPPVRLEAASIKLFVM